MPPEVFLSCARADGETLAADLRQRLAREAPDIVVIEGGAGWWKRVAEAIDGVNFLVLLMTPAALASGNVQPVTCRRNGQTSSPISASAATRPASLSWPPT